MQLMRRKEREITNMDEILSILSRCSAGRLGLCVEGRPYIVPLCFAYRCVEGRLILIFHGAREGRKLDMLSQNPIACFEADIPGAVVSGSTPDMTTIRYESVMAFGSCRLLEDASERLEALRALSERYAPGVPSTVSAEAAAPTALFALEAEEVTAKRNLG